MKDIMFVIIYGIMEYMFLKNGKMSNIKILKNKRVKMAQILLQRSYKPIMKEKCQIRNITIILIFLVVNGQQLCLQLNIVNKFLLNNGIINQIYKMMMDIQLQCTQLNIVNKFLQKNGSMIQNFKMLMEIQLPLNQHLKVSFLQNNGNMIHLFKDFVNIQQL